MEHIGIDLGSVESQVCVRSAQGQIVEEFRCGTRGLGERLGGRPRSRVVMETCSEALGVADQLKAAGHDVRVVPATLAKTLGVGARGLKTDVRDARALSEVSTRVDLPSTHVRTVYSRKLSTLCTFREAMVQSRSKLICTVRSYLRVRLLRMRGTSAEGFAPRVREMLQGEPEAVPAFVEPILKSIESLNEQVAQMDEQLMAWAKQDEVCSRLQTMPGVGPVTSARYRVALDQVHRFEHVGQVESYLGLTPAERSSSKKSRRLGITKAGPPKVRWALVQAAWSFYRTRPGDPNVLWAQKVAERRGRPVAIVALARRMATMMYAMWRDGTEYDPSHCKQKRQQMQQAREQALREALRKAS